MVCAAPEPWHSSSTTLRQRQRWTRVAAALSLAACCAQWAPALPGVLCTTQAQLVVVAEDAIGTTAGGLQASTVTAQPQASVVEQPSGVLEILRNLQLEEDVIRDAEKEVDKELEADPPSALDRLFERARLMNLRAILSDEEATIKSEEQDLRMQNQAAFRKDVDKLEGLERAEASLQFTEEEREEMTILQRFLSKFK